MRRIIALLALLLAPSLASAQGFIRYTPPASAGGAAWDGGAFTAPALGPVACVNPAYSFTGQATSGLCSEVAVVWLQAASGTTNTSKLKLSTGSARLEFYDATALDGDIIFSNDSAALSTGGVTMTQWTPTAVGFGNSTNFDRLILQPVIPDLKRPAGGNLVRPWVQTDGLRVRAVQIETDPCAGIERRHVLVQDAACLIG